MDANPLDTHHPDMGKLICFIVMLCSLPMALCNAPNGTAKGAKELKNWYKKVPHVKQKVTHLHFYLHDIVSGPNPTNIPIAFANSTARSPTYFGLIAAIDDPLTAGPRPDSEVVGRAQGILGSTSLEEIVYHMTFSLVFTNGAYNGSTLTVVGCNPFMNEYRELSVVGGSGVFRLARGTALLNTLTFNSTSGDAVVEYDVMVMHY